jgi:superfamily II DNA or RNA helicase
MNFDIEIHKKNESFLKIRCSRGVAQELSDYFSFYVPGYKFNPKYKAKVWDGIIRVFSAYTQELPCGLINRLIKFCKEREYSYKICYDNSSEELDTDSIKQYIKDLNIHSKGEKITARDYQVLGLFLALKQKRNILLSATSSGKSLIAYLISRYLIEHGCKKGLIIVPTVSLCSQLESDFQDYSSNTDWDVYDNVHTIFSGQEKSSNKPIIISTWQSLHNIENKSFFEEFDFVINDEVHLAQASSISDIINNCINSIYKIGMTGTLSGSKTHENVLTGLFGEPIRISSTKELIDKKQATDLKIKCLLLKYDEDICNKFRKQKLKYQEEIKYIISNKHRNIFIKNLAISMNKNTLLLFQLVESHGKILYDLIKDSKLIGNRKVFFIHGKTEIEDRESIRSIVESEENAIIIASNGVFSTGVSIKNLHNVIFTHPSKSRIRTLQSIGRILRLNNDKDHATLYDIVDDLSTDSYQNFAVIHFLERIKFYNQEKFNYKLYNIKLN